jgi:hypothetical protein
MSLRLPVSALLLSQALFYLDTMLLVCRHVKKQLLALKAKLAESWQI